MIMHFMTFNDKRNETQEISQSATKHNQNVYKHIREKSSTTPKVQQKYGAESQQPHQY